MTLQGIKVKLAEESNHATWNAERYYSFIQVANFVQKQNRIFAIDFINWMKNYSSHSDLSETLYDEYIKTLKQCSS